MAFDQSTRNRLQKFVSSARAILSEEFTRQLQATYGLDPKLGTNAPIKSLTHLDNRQRQTAHLLRETLAHYLATTPGKTEKDRIKQVLDRIVREQAFTVLNRLAALRMAEARGFLLESIAKAHSSKGFQLYRQLSGTAHGETGDAYKNYLFSLFDEFSLDLAVLFDRHSAQGRLFPRESALLELLGEINHADIEHLWAEDETIGWIYQYFNSQEERKKMRAESQAPRNSRELAVRNQFFTPRYVVEFLTDNTLGRIWYEMTQGNTALVDSCRYLVRRPTEIFLKPGEVAPEIEQNDEALSQQELLQQPVYIPHRPLKDPRTIRMLDPACGSMHFGLYAFDLFERIYLEAWQLEQQLGAAAFTREDGLASLQETYASLDVFKQQIPKLIIEHNIHGVDIDPRAVQIAGLSLWQRAQRAWHQQGIKPQQRPTIVKSNIVCAEPMPGEKALLQEFTSKLNPPVLGQLLEVIFDKMQLAGEAGTLLKIEEEIQTAIQEAREQWLKQSGSRGTSDLFQAELDAAIPQTTLGFDLRGINDESFWDDAEQRILQALSDYAEQAEATADQKRLFAEDASKGFAFIDLCRKRFDVVLMNPPYGALGESIRKYSKNEYQSLSNDFYALFVLRAIDLTHHDGLTGCLSSRTFMTVSNMKLFREKICTTFDSGTFIDHGMGVLDGAAVDTSSYVLFKSGNINGFYFYNLAQHDEITFDNCSFLSREIIKNLNGFEFAYRSSNSLTQMYSSAENRIRDYASSKMGISTGSDNRYLRLWWEVPNEQLTLKWMPFAKGGEYSRYYYPIHLVINYGREFEDIALESGARIQGKSLYKKMGITWPWLTSKGFNPRILPEDVIFANISPNLPCDKDNIFKFLAYLASNLASDYLDKITPSRNYTVEQVNQLPFDLSDVSDEIALKVESIVNLKLSIDSLDEISPNFVSSNVFRLFKFTFGDSFHDFSINLTESFKSLLEMDAQVQDSFGFDASSNNQSKDILSILFPKAYISKDDYLNFLLSFVFGLYVKRFDICEGELNPFKFSTANCSISKSILDQSVFESPDADVINRVICESFGSECSNFLDTIAEARNDISLLEYYSNVNYFFDYHLKRYSKNKRLAPVYWPLQTRSGSFTIWVYYQRINEQTLYICVNDFIEPKLAQVEQNLQSLRGKHTRNSQEETELEKLSDLASELRDFRDELLHVAKFWKPNLNDGVQITAAPLWKLFQHKAWQKKLKETWESLEQGEYDWAHLACSIWPDRVLRKCHEDRSLAIAHDVEGHFWHEVGVPVTRGKKATGETKFEWQPKDLTEPEILNLIKQIKEEKGL